MGLSRVLIATGAAVARKAKKETERNREGEDQGPYLSITLSAC